MVAEQAQTVQEFIIQNKIQRVMEIGFNGGISSAVILSASPDVELVSFDIGDHDYVNEAKRLIDDLFPSRHTLILGDSTVTVPMYQATPFDLVIVDGGHVAPIPEKDLRNVHRLVRSNGWIMMDDYCEAHGRYGVIDAYDTVIREGLYKTVATYQAHDRGWVFAKKL